MPYRHTNLRVGTLTIGGVKQNTSDSAITGFVAGANLAGQDQYVETQDAGGSATAARTGGLYSLKTGDGSAGALAVIAGAGGAMSFTTGAGGAASGTAAGGAGGATAVTSGVGGAHTGGGATGAGGAGGAGGLVAGAGGATSNVGSDNGGAGGAVAITAGVGGAASAGTGDGGAGGVVTITAGAGGASAAGVAGAVGKVKVAAGLLHAANAQTIDMNDLQVVLTLVPGTPTGTLITSNLMYVDANSSTNEDLLLPPEADCNGLTLWIANTGGETINVKEDGDSTTIATIATSEVGVAFCDGTTWRGGIVDTSDAFNGVTASVTELNYLDGTVLGTAVASKALGLGANKNVDTLVIADGGLYLGAVAGTQVTSTAAELNLLDTATAGTAVASKALIAGANKNLDTLVIADGGLYLGAVAGTAVTATAAEINVLDAVSGGTVSASLAVVVDASSDIAGFNNVDAAKFTAAALVLESLNPATIRLNDVDALQLDNAAIAAFAAATDTAGNSVYIETEDGGGTATAARAGGLYNLKTGDGSAGATTVIAGAGGAMSLTTGAGGAQTGTVSGGAGGALALAASAGGANSGAGGTGTGGDGGASSLVAGAGGATDNAGTDNAGAGGAMAITAGGGGAASAGTGDGGAGGAVTVTTGAGGATTGGAAGASGKFTLAIGAVDALQIHDSAIAAFAAATDTAGQDVYLETEDAGGTATTAKTGALLSLKTGDGSAGTAAVIAGAGGAFSLTTGLGGAASGTAAGGAGGAMTLTGSAGGAHTGGGATGAGGAGGAGSLIAGAGGATSNVGTSNGGAGGDIAITAGVGGAASAGTGDGGAGGDITLTAGAIGTTTGGIDGNPGKVKVAAGLFHLGNAQVIAMGDAAVTLTLVDGTPTGTLLTSNILAVDAESSGTENLLLPHEADCAGLVLWIRNTGGESIVLQDDAAGTIATIATAESAYAFCDGTAWQALNFA